MVVKTFMWCEQKKSHRQPVTGKSSEIDGVWIQAPSHNLHWQVQYLRKRIWSIPSLSRVSDQELHSSLATPYFACRQRNWHIPTNFGTKWTDTCIQKIMVYMVAAFETDTVMWNGDLGIVIAGTVGYHYDCNLYRSHWWLVSLYN